MGIIADSCEEKDGGQTWTGWVEGVRYATKVKRSLEVMERLEAEAKEEYEREIRGGSTRPAKNKVVTWQRDEEELQWELRQVWKDGRSSSGSRS